MKKKGVQFKKSVKKAIASVQKAAAAQGRELALVLQVPPDAKGPLDHKTRIPGAEIGLDPNAVYVEIGMEERVEVTNSATEVYGTTGKDGKMLRFQTIMPKDIEAWKAKQFVLDDAAREAYYRQEKPGRGSVPFDDTPLDFPVFKRALEIPKYASDEEDFDFIMQLSQQEREHTLTRLPLHKQKKFAEWAIRRHAVAKRKLDDIEGEVVHLSRTLEEKRAIYVCLRDYVEWNGKYPFKLEKNDVSRYHKMVENLPKAVAINPNTVKIADQVEVQGVDASKFKYKDAQVFVVQHDWNLAFGEHLGEVVAGEVKLPYETCAFEFRISGRTIIVLAHQQGSNVLVTFMIGTGTDYWFGIAEPDEGSDLVATEGLLYAWAQVKAICVALDSQVATHEIVRAPIALNKKRVAAGKLPLWDYHVVDLSRRLRAERNPNPEQTGRRVRLHFRRGHYRHYTSHKVWIKWMLVGNPDLGYVEKEYRL